jgi:hypothetical protein
MLYYASLQLYIKPFLHWLGIVVGKNATDSSKTGTFLCSLGKATTKDLFSVAMAKEPRQVEVFHLLLPFLPTPTQIILKLNISFTIVFI